MLRENDHHLKAIYTSGQSVGSLVIVVLFGFFFGLSAFAATTPNSAASQSQSQSQSQSSAVPSAPAIIAPDDMKKYIPGLGGTIDGATNTAHLNGFIDASCSKLLRLDATGVPANGKIIFAMYDLGGGLACLKKTADNCKVNSNCLSFEKIDTTSKHRLSRPFKSYVQVEKVNTGMKIALASSGHLSVKGDDEKLRKLEAAAGCDCDITPKLQGPFKPDQISSLRAVADATKAAGGKVKSDPLKPKPIPDENDDSDGDGDEPAAPQQPLPQIMHTRTPAGLQHVPTDQEMASQVYQDMRPYLTPEQGGTYDTSANTAYSAFVAQQSQAELARIQQYRPSNYLLGGSAFPGYMNLNGNTQSFQNSADGSLLLATPIAQPVQQFQPYPYGYPPGFPIPQVPAL